MGPYLRKHIGCSPLKVEDLVIEGVVMGVTRDGAGLALNILTAVLESGRTTGLGVRTRLQTAYEALPGTGAPFLARSISPE